MINNWSDLIQFQDKFSNDECKLASGIIDDIKCFLEKNSIKEFRRLLCRVYFSDKKEIICFICNLDINSIEDLKNIKVYGFWGEDSNNAVMASDYFFMEIGVKLNCRDIPIEIKTINSGQPRRQGRGSLGIRFLEEEIIPGINKMLELYGIKEKIGYIYGISADLCDDTNALARAKFYSKNGFKIVNSHFYKNIK